MQTKLQWYHYSPTRKAKIKLTISSIAEEVEQLELIYIYISGSNINSIYMKLNFH